MHKWQNCSWNVTHRTCERSRRRRLDGVFTAPVRQPRIQEVGWNSGDD
jgi:hypothetical protein